jgi:predicted alpha/beta hydrolase family esterase
MTDIIILPGIGGSGPTHWQSRWERDDRRMRRFQPADWDRPNLADRISAVDRAVGASTEPPLLVAHSLACLLVAHWQHISRHKVAGALLVAVPDPQSGVFPNEAAGFADVPRQQMRFPSLIIASTDDPYGSIEHGRVRAEEWGSGIVEIGAFGHINGQSGLEDWPHGKDILKAFLAGCIRL